MERMLSVITAVAAIIGAAASIIKVVRGRPRLRVTAMFYIATTGDSGWIVRAVNTGSVPVTITQVGFIHEGDPSGVILFRPHRSLGAQRLPQLMHPGAFLEFYTGPSAHDDPSFANGARPFAKTASGKVFAGPMLPEPS